eukprot:g30627.t1
MEPAEQSSRQRFRKTEAETLQSAKAEVSELKPRTVKISKIPGNVSLKHLQDSELFAGVGEVKSGFMGQRGESALLTFHSAQHAAQDRGDPSVLGGDAGWPDHRGGAYEA